MRASRNSFNSCLRSLRWCLPHGLSMNYSLVKSTGVLKGRILEEPLTPRRRATYSVMSSPLGAPIDANCRPPCRTCFPPRVHITAISSTVPFWRAHGRILQAQGLLCTGQRRSKDSRGWARASAGISVHSASGFCSAVMGQRRSTHSPALEAVAGERGTEPTQNAAHRQDDIRNSQQSQNLSSHLEGLNQEQLRAVTSSATVTRVVAGPGTGKTRVLTHRVVHLIRDLGVAPKDILCVTFTNKAAAELKERLEGMLEFVPGGSTGITVGTFHSFCASLLRHHINLLPFAGRDRNFTIFDDDDCEKLVRMVTAKGKEKDSVAEPEEESTSFDFKKESTNSLQRTQSVLDSLGEHQEELFHELLEIWKRGEIGDDKEKDVWDWEWEDWKKCEREWDPDTDAATTSAGFEQQQIGDFSVLEMDKQMGQESLLVRSQDPENSDSSSNSSYEARALHGLLLGYCTPSLTPRKGDAASAQEERALPPMLTGRSLSKGPWAETGGAPVAADPKLEFPDLFVAYQRLKRGMNAVEFRDLLQLAVLLLRSSEKVWGSPLVNYRHILVDEFQDTDAVQYELVRLLATKGGRNPTQGEKVTGNPRPMGSQSNLGGRARGLFVVGDVDQSIYGFRGAWPMFLQSQFDKDYPGCATFQLAENFRSTSSILQAAMGVISLNNDSRSVGGLSPLQLKPKRGKGQPVQVINVQSCFEEAKLVRQRIQRLMGLQTRERSLDLEKTWKDNASWAPENVKWTREEQGGGDRFGGDDPSGVIELPDGDTQVPMSSTCTKLRRSSEESASSSSAAWGVVSSNEALRPDALATAGSFAVLYRTRALSGPIEAELLANGIPFVVLGGTSLLDRRDPKTLLAYLRLVVNPLDGVALARVINNPPRGIGPKALKSLENWASLQKKSLAKAVFDLGSTGGTATAGVAEDEKASGVTGAGVEERASGTTGARDTRGAGDEEEASGPTEVQEAEEASMPKWAGVSEEGKASLPVKGTALKGFLELVDLLTQARMDAEFSSPGSVLEFLAEETRYLEHISKAGEAAKAKQNWKKEKEAKQRLAAARDFLNACSALGKTVETGMDGIREFLELLALSSYVEDDFSEQKGKKEDKLSADAVKLSTIHGVKGLEFDHVFMVGMEHGIIPSAQSIKENMDEEEIRVCYVGMTRARHTLVLSHANARQMYGKTLRQAPSPYLSNVKGSLPSPDENRWFD